MLLWSKALIIKFHDAKLENCVLPMCAGGIYRPLLLIFDMTPAWSSARVQNCSRVKPLIIVDVVLGQRNFPHFHVGRVLPVLVASLWNNRKKKIKQSHKNPQICFRICLPGIFNQPRCSPEHANEGGRKQWNSAYNEHKAAFLRFIFPSSAA